MPAQLKFRRKIMMLPALLMAAVVLPLGSCKREVQTVATPPTQLSDPTRALAAKVDQIRVVDVEAMRKEESDPHHAPIILNVTQDSTGRIVKSDTLLLVTSRVDPAGRQRDGLIPWHIDDLKPTPESAEACSCPCDPFRRRFRKGGPVGLCPFPASNKTVPVCVDTTAPDTSQEAADESLHITGLPALSADPRVDMCSYKFSVKYADGNQFDPHLQIHRGGGSTTKSGGGAQ